MPKRERNLFQRNGIWYARVKHRGRRYRPSLRTGNREEARQKLKAFKARLRAADHAASGDGGRGHRYADAVIKFFAEYAPGNLKPGATKRYQVSARQLDARFGEKALAEIDQAEVSAYVSGRIKAGVSNATIRRDLTTLSRILAVAQNAAWIPRNPVRDFDRSMIKERRDPIRLPTAEQVGKLTSRAPGNFGRLIDFLDATGMREEEAASLEWPDIEKGRRRWIVHLLKTKTSRPRSIVLTPRARAILETAKPSTAVAWVFWHPTPDGDDRYRRVSARFRQIADGLKLEEMTAHHLRHRFCVQWLRKGGDIYDLAKYVGHASIKTTEGYLAFLPQGAQKGPQVERFSGGTRARGLPRGI